MEQFKQHLQQFLFHVAYDTTFILNDTCFFINYVLWCTAPLMLAKGGHINKYCYYYYYQNLEWSSYGKIHPI